METLKLKAEIREKTGGLSSKKAIYENKLVPGVVYGGKDAPVAIQVIVMPLNLVVRSPNSSTNHLNVG